MPRAGALATAAYSRVCFRSFLGEIFCGWRRMERETNPATQAHRAKRAQTLLRCRKGKERAREKGQSGRMGVYADALSRLVLPHKPSGDGIVV